MCGVILPKAFEASKIKGFNNSYQVNILTARAAIYIKIGLLQNT